MNDLAKNLIVWLVLAAILMSVFNSFAPEVEQNNIDYSDFINEVQNDRVSEVVIADLIITGERNDGSKFRSVRPNMQDPKLMDDLMNHNVRVMVWPILDGWCMAIHQENLKPQNLLNCRAFLESPNLCQPRFR